MRNLQKKSDDELEEEEGRTRRRKEDIDMSKEEEDLEDDEEFDSHVQQAVHALPLRGPQKQKKVFGSQSPI